MRHLTPDSRPATPMPTLPKPPVTRPGSTVGASLAMLALAGMLLGLAPAGPALARDAAAASPAGAAKSAPPPPSARKASCPALLDRTLPRLQDEMPQDLCQYAGKVLLVVNTASRCGFTPQYEGLEALHRRYEGRGLVVMGFPSNDFAQEPGSTSEIADLCFNTYGVRFPMFAKTSVRGATADPFFAELARHSGPPKWNFYKYLIGRDGTVIGSYSSMTSPLDTRLTRDVERALAR